MLCAGWRRAASETHFGAFSFILNQNSIKNNLKKITVLQFESELVE